MNATQESTFAVSRVSVAAEPLAELPYHEAVKTFLGGSIESCSRYHGTLVANVVSHPLIAAVHAGFAHHRPVVLSPDIIWLTITQGLAIHINENSESLRHQLVSHEGKLTIKVIRNDFVKGSPENPWQEVFAAFSRQIRSHIGNSHDLIVADFSTTGPVERAASEVVLLDSMQRYFSYELHTLCGIPAITLQGTVSDWESIAKRVEGFSRFGLDWWIEPLRPILTQFVEAASGRVDKHFWRSIYKYQDAKSSGSPWVSGWVRTLFPYLCGWQGAFRRNSWIGARESNDGPSREAFPNTPSKAPFKWFYLDDDFEMDFIGGLLGVSQDRQTRAIRPEIGWAVRDQHANDLQNSEESWMRYSAEPL